MDDNLMKVDCILNRERTGSKTATLGYDAVPAYLMCRSGGLRRRKDALWL
ncbi:MAG: hypothetical protein KGK17_03740 [Betaproteobacteria bacterium]|nr:hypothetical protein [Betaproteobacteria bacterium]